MQLMNEDSSPFTHSGTSHLFGASIFLPTKANPVRLTAEYSDSVSTLNIFSFGDDLYGFSYTNGQYPDGMRYRGRTIGFSLDDDSRLLVAARLLERFWRPLLRIELSSRQYRQHSFAGRQHPYRPCPVTINMGEARRVACRSAG